MIASNSSSSSIPNIEKIGNLIIYLVEQIHKKHRQRVYLTKLLKLLYIIDETSVKETGAPVTGMDYRVWKMGPVAYDVYTDLMHNDSQHLSTFVEARKSGGDSPDKGGALIDSTNTFDDSEFSDYEMSLIDRVVDQFGHMQRDQLIALLHEEGSLWKKIVDAKGLEARFKSDNTSSYKIDFRDLISNDPYKLQVFQSAQDSLNL